VYPPLITNQLHLNISAGYEQANQYMVHSVLSILEHQKKVSKLAPLGAKTSPPSYFPLPPPSIFQNIQLWSKALKKLSVAVVGGGN